MGCVRMYRVVGGHALLTVTVNGGDGIKGIMAITGIGELDGICGLVGEDEVIAVLYVDGFVDAEIDIVSDGS